MIDNIRDYTTDAFRFFAEKGRPTYDQMIGQIKQEIIINTKAELSKNKNISNPTEYAIINAERAVEEREAELLDILAVYNTMELLNKKPNGIYIKKAIENVYFANPYTPLKKGDIEQRVVKASLAIPCSERQVYRYLVEVRKMFAVERKLRIS